MTVLRLLLVSASLDPEGGGAAALGRLIAHAMGRYCDKHGGELEILHLGETKHLPSGLDCRPYRGSQTALAAAVLQRQMARRCDAIVFDHLGPSRTEGALLRGFRAPYLVFLLGIEVWRPLDGTRRKALEGATQRLAISNHTARRAREHNDWLPPVDVVYPALEHRALVPRPRAVRPTESWRTPEEDFFLIVGRLAAQERYKGHETLFSALESLRRDGVNAQLVVSGDGDDRARLQQIVFEKSLGDLVTFTGFVSEAALLDLYAHSRAFVMTSGEEGFGLVYLEAMAAGKPCVALRGSAAEEIVLDHVTGLLVDEGVEPLAQALATLASDPELSKRLGAAGQARFRDKFSYEAFEARFFPHLETLLASRVRH